MNEVLKEVFEMAVQIITKNRLQLPQDKIQMPAASVATTEVDYKSRIRCNTGDILKPLTKMLTEAASDVDHHHIHHQVLDAKSFVEDYEEFHDCCSEMTDPKIGAYSGVEGEETTIERGRSRKKKEKSVKHGGVTCMIAVSVFQKFDSVFLKNYR